MPFESATGLFRTFSELALTKEAVMQFADQYGSLGEEVEESITVLFPAGSQIKDLGPFVEGKRQIGIHTLGENFSKWTRHIFVMRELIFLWEAARNRDQKVLTTLIDWDGDAVRYRSRSAPRHKNKPFITWQAWDETRPEIRARLKHGELLDPAWYVLQDLVNKELMAQPSTAQLLWAENGSLQLFVVPSSLIAALWLQFSFAINEDRRYLKCASCEKWFQIGRGGDARADARFCSNACRQKSYRERRERSDRDEHL